MPWMHDVAVHYDISTSCTSQSRPKGAVFLVYVDYFLVTAGEDYIGISTVLTFVPTMDLTSVISVNVSVLDDDVTEGDERFEALLDILTTGTLIFFVPSGDRAPATILDDDSKLNQICR